MNYSIVIQEDRRTFSLKIEARQENDPHRIFRPIQSRLFELITLHRFNSGKEFVLNADQIKMIEETPDTLITLMNSEKILVEDSLSDVLKKTISFARAIRTPAEYLSEPLSVRRDS